MTNSSHAEENVDNNKTGVDKDVIFQLVDWRSCNETDDSNKNTFVIRLFGRTKDNQTVYTKVTNFKPFFYVEIPKSWSDTDVTKFITGVKSKVRKELHEGLYDYKIVEKHKFYGFTNYAKFKFVKLVFNDIG